MISIHALREEGDASAQTKRYGHPDFYPRPPRGGRRGGHWMLEAWTGISIHALREEGDIRIFSSKRRLQNFYPRPPRGGRLENALTSR